MIAKWVPAYRHQPDDYRSAPAVMDLIDPSASAVVAGRAVRTGVTRPGFPDRAIYRIVVKGTETFGSWVFEGGRFVESNHWHRCRAAGYSPTGG